jgi:beta-galactosidase
MPKPVIKGTRSWLASVVVGLAVLDGFGIPAQAPRIRAGAVRERVILDEGWRFKKDDAPGVPAPTREDLQPWLLPTSNAFIKDSAHRRARPAGRFGQDLPYARPDFDDSAWRVLDLPHDWGIEGPFSAEGGGGTGRLPFYGVGWYRKVLDVPASDAGRSIFLDVDGAMSYAAVWLNGEFVGGWPYGYASWRVDLTPYIKPGSKNVLAIRLDNPPNSSRWYPGGGIYRHVWLMKTSTVHVAHWGTFVTTPSVTPASAKIDIEVTLDNDSDRDARVRVSSELFPLDGRGVKAGRAVAATPGADLNVPRASSARIAQSATVTKPRLWGPPPTQVPNRYVVVTTVERDGTVVDRYEIPFGIRTLTFDAEGFAINGERLDFRGVCMHHDLGALGAALNERALHRQIDMLIEMGVNAIRTSHNPPAPELLDYADEKGILVMDETLDVWRARKTPFDYHLLFDAWHEQDTRMLIRRDRNHPSVVMWSIGNEALEQGKGEEGAAIARMLNAIARDEDPTRKTTTAMNSARADSPFPSTVDLIGLNYQGTGVRGNPPQYPVFRQRYPDAFIFGAETASAISSRGEYTFPVAGGFGSAFGPSAGQDLQRRHMSSYDLYWAPWGAAPDHEFHSQARWPFVAGEFVWTGWDYLGEPTPYDASRSSYFGIIDLAGFKKDRFYLYQAHWRPDHPMAHILPHWNWPERAGLKEASGALAPTPVHVYTSGEEGELFVNGRSLGRKKRGPGEYRLRWDDVVYEPGTLRVVAYRNGQQWATAETRTTRAPAQLGLTPDRREVRGDGRDLVFITLAVQDKDGRTVPRANNQVQFTIQGPGRIVATDNGDPTSFESFLSPERRAFNGLALAIVHATRGARGTIRVTASADGLQPGSTDIRVIQ